MITDHEWHLQHHDQGSYCELHSVQLLDACIMQHDVSVGECPVSRTLTGVTVSHFVSLRQLALPM